MKESPAEGGGKWTPRSVAAAAALAAVLVGALILVPADRAPQEHASLPDAPIPTVKGDGVTLASCPTAKCLTVIVAPWCGYCRASTTKLVELKKFLDANKTAMRVVVGMDQPGALLDYAREFGPQTLVDRDGLVSARGVPFFIVTDAAGNVLQTAAGVPPGGIQSVREFAAGFGLP